MNEDHKTVCTVMLETAKEGLEQGIFQPIGLIKAMGKIIAIEIAEERDKVTFKTILEEITKAGQDAKAGLMLDTFVVAIQEGDRIEGGRPSADPRRKDALMIVSADSESYCSVICQYTSQDGKFTFEEPMYSSESTNSSFFPDSWSMNHEKVEYKVPSLH